VDLTSGKAQLNDVPCNSKYQYICEVISVVYIFCAIIVYWSVIQGRLKTVPQVVEQECKIVYSLTSG
jgi:hypothetical protein